MLAIEPGQAGRPVWPSPEMHLIKPRDVALFHGSIDLEKLNALEKTAIKKVEAPSGDFRDRDAIGAWAADIAEAVCG